MAPEHTIEDLIFGIRGKRVILDADLAELYGVDTKRLNEQVKRNPGRFPADFAFQLSRKEWAELRSQTATSNPEDPDNEAVVTLKSQVATSKRGGRRTLPWVFTEHGAIMAANVLNSARAVAMSVYVVRAFVELRERLSLNQNLLKRLAEMDQELLKHDVALKEIYEALVPLLQPEPEHPKRRIGFHP